MDEARRVLDHCRRELKLPWEMRVVFADLLDDIPAEFDPHRPTVLTLSDRRPRPRMGTIDSVRRSP